MASTECRVSISCRRQFFARLDTPHVGLDRRPPDLIGAEKEQGTYSFLPAVASAIQGPTPSLSLQGQDAAGTQSPALETFFSSMSTRACNCLLKMRFYNLLLVLVRSAGTFRSDGPQDVQDVLAKQFY